MMENTRTVLAFLWTSLMLVYLLGDVLRIYMGDATPGEIMGNKATQPMFLFIAFFMLIPIIMIMMNVLFSGSAVRILNLSVTVIFFLFNLIGLPGYKSWYDIFLLAFSLIINCLIFWKAF